MSLNFTRLSLWPVIRSLLCVYFPENLTPNLILFKWYIPKVLMETKTGKKMIGWTGSSGGSIWSWETIAVGQYCVLRVSRVS